LSVKWALVKTLEETSLSKAVTCRGICRGALDQIGLRYFPFVKRSYLKLAGKEITDEAAKQIVQKSLARRVGDKVLGC
jgi:hypothetical protein